MLPVTTTSVGFGSVIILANTVYICMRAHRQVSSMTLRLNWTKLYKTNKSETRMTASVLKRYPNTTIIG